MAEAFIMAIHSMKRHIFLKLPCLALIKNKNSSAKQTRKANSRRVPKKYQMKLRQFSNRFDIICRNELRPEVSSVKETVNSVNSRMVGYFSTSFRKVRFLNLSLQVNIKKQTEKLPLHVGRIFVMILETLPRQVSSILSDILVLPIMTMTLMMQLLFNQIDTLD